METKPNQASLARWIGAAAIILSFAAAVFIIFNSSFQDYSDFYLWTSALAADDIQAASVSRGYGGERITYDLSNEERIRLSELFRGIDEECIYTGKSGFTPPEYTLYIRRSGREFVFRYDPKNTEIIAVGFEEITARTFGPSGCILINSPELCKYILEYF